MLSRQYRPDIDGLRAIAVSAVLLFHAFPTVVPGGFVGVDVFFVISGFLITSIIRDQKAAGRFSLAHFYERRIRRIFPALIVVLGVTYIAGWLLFLPTEFEQLGTNTIAGAAFFANISLLMQSGYFDIEAAKKPLLHLWSLGIEEQFYIAWPILLMLASRFRNGVIWMIGAIGVASFALNLLLVARHPEATFYLPFTRAWELLAGAFLTYTRLESRKLRDVTAVLGIALILAAALKLNAKVEFPGWRAALPVAGALALIASPGSLVNRYVLGNPLLVAIGLISYPIYLWHWPLIVFATAMVDDLSVASRLLIIAACVVLASATYRFIETPIRTGRLGKTKVAALGVAMASIAAIGAWTVHGDGLIWRFPDEMQSILQARVQADRWRTHQCWLLDGDTAFSDECVDRGRHPLVFLWGDSTAGALTPGLRDLQQKRDFGLAQFTISSCEPSITEVGGRHCGDLNRKAFSALVETQPDIVLLEAIWYPADEHLDALASTIAAIRKQSAARIVVLGRAPVWEGGIKQHIFDFYKMRRALPIRLPQSEKDKSYDVVMRDRLGPFGVTFISAWDALCNAGGCLVRLPDASGKMDLSATDTLHLSEAGSSYLISAIQNDIFPP